VYRGAPRNQPRLGTPARIVLHEVPWTDWFADCRTAPRAQR
jgi:hypothetical protein